MPCVIVVQANIYCWHFKKVKSIYQPIEGEKDQYAIYLVCKQNGSEVRVLLLVKIAGDKVSEMTYNTVKQEY